MIFESIYGAPITKENSWEGGLKVCELDKENTKENYIRERGYAEQAKPESHMVYELKQRREYHLQQLVIIQEAINAVNRVS